MEKPSEWNEVQKTIYSAVAKCDEDLVDNKPGGSFVMYVYNALKDKGYLKDEY